MKNTHWQKHTFASVFCFEMLKNIKNSVSITTNKHMKHNTGILCIVVWCRVKSYYHHDTNPKNDSTYNYVFWWVMSWLFSYKATSLGWCVRMSRDPRDMSHENPTRSVCCQSTHARWLLKLRQKQILRHAWQVKNYSKFW